VADTHREIVKEHTWQYARDLLRRVPLFEQLLDLRPQETIKRQQSGFTTVRSSHASPLLGKNGSVTTGQSGPARPKSLCLRTTPLITSKLSTHRARASVQAKRNGSNGGSFLKAQLNQNSLFIIKMLVFGFHRNTVPQG
jgi:hypothetical protein